MTEQLTTEAESVSSKLEVGAFISKQKGAPTGSDIRFLNLRDHDGFFPLVASQFNKHLEPLYGSQAEALRRIRAAKDRACEILIHGGEFVGVLVYKTVPTNEYESVGISHSLEVKTLFVCNPEVNSGRGFGKALLRRAAEVAVASGAHGIHVTCSTTKKRVLGFFEGYGFALRYGFAPGESAYLTPEVLLSHGDLAQLMACLAEPVQAPHVPFAGGVEGRTQSLRVACSICGNEKDNSHISVREMVTGSRKEHSYLKCSKCFSMSIDAVPEDLKKLYENYPTSSSPWKRPDFFGRWIKRCVLRRKGFIASLLARCLHRYEDLPIRAMHPYAFPYEARILDVGCGNGALVRDLRELGYRNAIGIDRFADVCGRGGPGAECVVRADLVEISGTYDVIMFNHSFEHFLDPEGVLRKVRSLVSPGGVVIIRLPNVRSVPAREFGANWEGLHAPYHFFLPSRAGMKEYTERCGFRILECRGEQLVFSFLNSENYRMNIADFDKHGMRTFVAKNPSTRFIKNIPPHISAQVVSKWRKIGRRLVKRCRSDYINYYLVPDLAAPLSEGQSGASQ